MDDIKICIKCNIEKKLSDFATYKNRVGEKVHRNVCKTCQNRKKGYDAEIKNIAPRIENKAIEAKREYKSMDIFTNKEIEVLKSIIEDYPEFKKLLNNKIELEKDDNEKIKRSISMSKQVDVKISNLVKNGTLNYSEVVNSLLKKALEFV